MQNDGRNMKLFTAPLLIVCWCLGFSAQAATQKFQLPIYNDLAMASDKALMTPNDEYQSMQKAIAVLVGCGMDKLCILMVMHGMSKNEDNLLYIHFYNALNKGRDDIMYTAMHCKHNKLKQVQMLQANCLAKLSDRLSNVKTRAKAEDALSACLKSNMIKLAKTKNVFARSEMFDYEVRRQNAKGIVYWRDQINIMAQSPQYADFSKCGKDL